jgi:hypothetical protein
MVDGSDSTEAALGADRAILVEFKQVGEGGA